MYFIEWIIKKTKKKKTHDQNYSLTPENTTGEYELCEHIFMPIDSTQETLSCTKCGFLVKRSELKNSNFFLNKKDT